MKAPPAGLLTLGLALACSGGEDYVVETPYYRATFTGVGEDGCGALDVLGAPVAVQTPMQNERPGFGLQLGRGETVCEEDGADVECRDFTVSATAAAVDLHGFLTGSWSGDDLSFDLSVRGVCAYDEVECLDPNPDDAFVTPPIPCASELAVELERLDPQPPGEAPAPDGSCEALADAVSAPGENAGLDVWNYSGVEAQLTYVGTDGAYGETWTVQAADDLGEPGHLYIEQSTDGSVYVVAPTGQDCVARFRQIGPWYVIGGGA